MGSGKTTHGKKLAALLKRSFTDLDAYIEQLERRSVTELFEQEGERAFREKENLHLKELLRQQQSMVIALGGGTVCFYDNLELVKQAGLLIYLELPADALADRLMQAGTARPLLKGLEREQMTVRVAELLSLRAEYYTQAHLTVNALSLTPKKLCQQIVDFVQK